MGPKSSVAIKMDPVEAYKTRRMKMLDVTRRLFVLPHRSQSGVSANP